MAFLMLAVVVASARWPMPRLEHMDPETAYETVRMLVVTLAPETTGRYQFPTWSELNAFIQRARAALDHGRMEDLAWMAEGVRHILDSLQNVPPLRPYTDWLRPRVDYFAMAAAAVHAVRGPGAPPAPVVQRSGPVPLLPTPPAPVKTPAEIVARREKMATQASTWEQLLAKRKPSPQVVQLAAQMKKIFAEEGLPEEWAWLAEVESSFDPEARSPAGAVGLYQLMPATAQRWGLALSPEDDRLDPLRNARAAARYLKFLHGRFGAWPLVFAAYNAGETRVARLLAAAPSKTFDAIAYDLPTETRLYVPKVMATVRLREGRLPA